jgi:hypothetical protein
MLHNDVNIFVRHHIKEIIIIYVQMQTLNV